MLTGLSGGKIGAYFCAFEYCPNSPHRTAIGNDPRAFMYVELLSVYENVSLSTFRWGYTLCSALRKRSLGS